MTTLEQAIETVSALPLAERRSLLQHFQQDLQEPERSQPTAEEREEKSRHELEKYRRAKQWIAEHRTEYLNQWVVLEGDRLISHGLDGHQVCEEARAAGIEVPFLVRITEEPKAFMTGIL